MAVYALGFLLRWDTIAIYSPVLPAVAFVIGFFVPESPVFLMHKVTKKILAFIVSITLTTYYNITIE